MTITKQKNRRIILSALFVNAFCCGGVYAWSVFSGSLAEYRNWDYGQVTLAYSLMSLMLSFFGIAGGKILDRFGPKKPGVQSQHHHSGPVVSGQKGLCLRAYNGSHGPVLAGGCPGGEYAVGAV